MMDVELLIHGVPSEHDIYGIKEEQANMELFYNSSIEPVKFVIEIKKRGNNAYCYYSYLRYKGIAGAGNRPGSYFGITLRLDKYYQDAIHIYNLLDILFKRNIVGTFLSQSGDGYIYTVNHFDAKKAELKNTQNVLVDLIKKTCVPSKYLDIDDSFVHPITSVPIGNIADVSEAAILSSIKKYSKIVLSPNYERSIEKEYQQKIQDAEARWRNVAVEKDKKIAEKDGTIASLNATIGTKNNEITALKQEVKNKDAEIQQNKQKSDLARLVESVKGPITALADYFKVKEPGTSTSKDEHVNSKLELLKKLGLLNSGLLLVILLVICIISSLRISNSKTDGVKDVEANIATLNETINRLKSDIKSKEKTISDLKAQIQAQTTVAEPASLIELRIDIVGYSPGTDLSPDKSYNVLIKNKTSKSNYSGRGKWVVTNAEITQGKGTDTQITIQPNGKGPVKLEYTADDKNCSCEARTINVSAPAKDGSKVSQNNSNPTDTDTITFSIKPDVDEVVIGETYEITVNYDGEGSWYRVDGFKKLTDDNSAKTMRVEVCPSSEEADGYAVISYLPKGWNKDKRVSFRKKIKADE